MSHLVRLNSRTTNTTSNCSHRRIRFIKNAEAIKIPQRSPVSLKIISCVSKHLLKNFQ